MQFAHKHVLFLGHDIQQGRYSLNIYISEQSKKLRKVSFKHEIRKFLGFFNVCGGLCPKLQAWVALVQALLKLKEPLSVANLREITTGTWTYILSYNTSLLLDQVLRAYYLMMN